MMRWIILLIGTLFITACGSVNNATEVQNQETQLSVQTSGSIDAVIANEYNVLINYNAANANKCQGAYSIFAGYSQLGSAAIDSNFVRTHGHLCLVTLNTTYDAALNDLSKVYDAYPEVLLEYSRNVRYGLDGASSSSFDPTCDQIGDMDDEAEDMERVEEKNFETAVVNTQNTETGVGVHVAIIGSGLGYKDTYSCQGASMVDHDNHIAEIISELVPNATITGYDACLNDGTCPSNMVADQMLKVWKQGHARQVVNLSLGGPQPDGIHAYIMKNLMSKTFFAASAGNGGSKITYHYPASFATVAVRGSTALNLMAVAAYGFDVQTGDKVLAEFNTSGVATIAAPGVNLCPSSVPTSTGRCSGTDVGISGTSFSTPYVSAVATMLMDEYSSSGWYTGRHYRNHILWRDLLIPGETVRAVNFY